MLQSYEMQMRYKAVLDVRRRTSGSLVLAAFLLSLAGACESGSPVSSSGTDPSSTGAPPPPPPAGTRYRLTGRVTSDAGSPIANAVVEVDHGKASTSPSTSNCLPIATFCWTGTHTNSNGEYAMEFEAGPMLDSGIGRGVGKGQNVGYVYSFADGYETGIQWVPSGSQTPVQDLQLRPIRPIRPGETTSVFVEPTSALCSDLEDNWMLSHRCEVVHVEASQEGTLLVEVTGSSAAPQALFFATTGNYVGGWTRTGPSTITAPVRPGLFLLFVGIPEGAASQRFDVVTSLR